MPELPTSNSSTIDYASPNPVVDRFQIDAKGFAQLGDTKENGGVAQKFHDAPSSGWIQHPGLYQFPVATIRPIRYGHMTVIR